MTHPFNKARCGVLAAAILLSGCDQSVRALQGPDAGASTSGGTTGGTTTGGTTTGGTTSGGSTTGGTSTGGTTGGGTTTGGTTTGGTSTGGTTGGTTSGGTTGGTTTGGAGSTGNASQCFDPTYGTPGTRIIASFRTTDGSSGAVVTTDYQQLVENGTFEGRNVLTATGPVTTTGESQSTSTVTQYYTLNTTQKTITVFGVDTNTTAPLNLQTQIRFIPEETGFLDLDVGESYTVSNTVRTTTSTSIPVQSTTTTDTQKTLKRTFLGLESVTVPAGTFTACKFQDEQTSTTNGATSTLVTTVWNFNNGINIKTVSDGDVSELISATVNGVPID